MWWNVALASTIALGFVMSTYPDASFAYPDAFTTSASLIAQFLLTWRYWFNWTFWIIVDIVAVYICIQKGLYPTAGLYFTFISHAAFRARTSHTLKTSMYTDLYSSTNIINRSNLRIEVEPGETLSIEEIVHS